MPLTKADAELEALRRWYQLPAEQRASFEQAEAYALVLEQELHFHSMMSNRRLLAAWLMREVGRGIRVTALPEAHAA